MVLRSISATIVLYECKILFWNVEGGAGLRTYFESQTKETVVTHNVAINAK